jgi:hypothetical protein
MTALCETGRRKNDKFSMNMTSGRMHRNAGWHEKLEISTRSVEAMDQDGEERQQRQRRGDDDVARNRERRG